MAGGFPPGPSPPSSPIAPSRPRRSQWSAWTSQTSQDPILSKHLPSPTALPISHVDMNLLSYNRRIIKTLLYPSASLLLTCSASPLPTAQVPRARWFPGCTDWGTSGIRGTTWGCRTRPLLGWRNRAPRSSPLQVLVYWREWVGERGGKESKEKGREREEGERREKEHRIEEI